MFIFLNLLNSDKVNKSDFEVLFTDISNLKNTAVVSTTSNCYARKDSRQVILDFGLFLVAQHLNESSVEIFTIPENLRPARAVYFTVSSTDGAFCATCSIEPSGSIKMGKTPSTSKYFVGQAVYYVGK